MQVSAWGIDIDTSCGGRRTTSTREGRTKKAVGRTKKFELLTKVGKQAKCIYRAGAHAQRTWGQAVAGTSPTTLASMRAAYASVTGYGGPGVCPFTVGCIVQGAAKDPAVNAAKDALAQRLRFAHRNPELLRNISRAWANIADATAHEQLAQGEGADFGTAGHLARSWLGHAIAGPVGSSQ